MFYSVIIALVLLFAGSTLLWNFLRDHPLVFLAYWAVCAWITMPGTTRWSGAGSRSPLLTVPKSRNTARIEFSRGSS